ncbi:hypothetical protein EV580_6318 [Mycobacterium sp. BK086]|uniref:hypothetical protein n=1 Tax=Mycobacterium sp. BK086 TaxID=2512165 RepID=UPI00105CD8DA|nr:hypothetical protein [Mycobacterium sp. BK086]TDO07349.1 hypothetical protein EV580_6318 [Mycobacterium sp. BK086]
MLSVHAPVQQPEATPRVVDTRPTVLITEQEVKLLTAAAIAAPAKQGLFSRWVVSHREARDARRNRQRYSPAHYEFLEHSAMARAMERL